MKKIAVLVSGGGTNLQALIDAQGRGELGNGKITLTVVFHPTESGIVNLPVGGKLERVSEDRAIALAELKTELAALSGHIYLVGDGAVLTHKTLSEEVSNLVLPAEHRIHQRAVGVALLAKAKIEAGENGDGNALTPNYLRLSQAERERLEKEKK